LRHVRQLRGYTQLELARLSGLSQSAIGSYESGERKSSRALLKLAAILGVEAQWLDTGKGPMEKTADSYGAVGPGADHMIMEAGLPPHPSKARAVRGEWPFPAIPPSRYESLTTRDKRQLENIVASFIDACQANYAVAKSKSRRGG
jgi:transcriptional regulator with XRE-family HTH domain